MRIRSLKNKLPGILVLAALAALVPIRGQAGDPPAPGNDLGTVTLPAATPEESAYLGVDSGKAFSLKDVNARLIVLEIMGVYCPQCHRQRPHINRLFGRIKGIPDLAGTVKFMGIASGSPPMEAAYYAKQYKVPYPILADETFAVHKALGEPRTPYNMVVTREGRVLYAHLGVIEDMDAFLETLKRLAARQ
jgi:peroxiredoxin